MGSTVLASADPTKTIDHYDLDDGDAAAPIRIPYLVPGSLGAIIKVTLSWYRLPFRSTVNLNPSTISTDATQESGHTHSHSHTIPIDFWGPSGAPNMSWPVGGNHFGSGAGPGTAPTNPDATWSSGHTHAHTHTLSGSSAQAVTEGPRSNVNSVLVDGLDKTALLGGPWMNDQVEMDITSVFAVAAGVWHVIELKLAGLGRLMTLLRVYYTT